MRHLYLTILSLLPIIAAAQVDTSDWNDVKITACLENEQVHKYMSEVAYADTYIKYTYTGYSKVGKYANEETDYRKDYPMPVVIPLPGKIENDMYLVYSDSLDMTRRDSVAIKKGSTEIHITNLIPSRTYYYNIEGVSKGTVHTTGLVRQLRFNTAFNIRDIGGWKTSNGNRLKYGLIYRGCELDDGFLNKMSSADLKLFKQVGIGAEIDMRTEAAHVSGGLQECSSWGDTTSYLGLLMSDRVNLLDTYESEYRQIFEFIHDNLVKGQPVYIHCSLGADRTGVLCALIELICGVSLSDVYKDFELTSMASCHGEKLLRYYSSINQRISHTLGIKDASKLQDAVIEYLTKRCGISETVLTEIKDIMLGEFHTSNGIFHQTISSEGMDNRVYTITGIKTNRHQKGIGIIRCDDGMIRKVIK